MRKFVVVFMLIAAISLGGGTSTVAAESHLLTLTRTMAVAGLSLRPAVYNLQWVIRDKQATVKFLTKDRVAATVQGMFLDLGLTPSSDTLYFSKRPDGSIAIIGLGFVGKNQGIIFPALGTRRRHESDSEFTREMLENFRSQLPRRSPLAYR
jgi:hypothetical protein